MKIKFEYRDYHRKISDTQCLEDLIAVSKKIGNNTVLVNDYVIHGKYDRNTIRRRFGSWYAALMLAGLTPTKARRNENEVTEGKLFKNLEEAWIKLGRQPKLKEMKYPLSWNCGNVYVRFFGSWSKAVKKFVEYQNSGCCVTNPIKKKIAPAQKEPTRVPQEKIKECKALKNGTREVPARLRFSVFIRDGLRCTVCGKSTVTHPGIELHCDHVIPWSKGGKTKMENLKTLCAECNRGKGDMMVA